MGRAALARPARSRTSVQRRSRHHGLRFASGHWCPTCKAQAPILSRLKGEARFKNLASFNIDFDSQKDLLKKFNVQKQSTLIVFKGKQEIGRSTGDSNAGSIEALVAKSI